LHLVDRMIVVSRCRTQVSREAASDGEKAESPYQFSGTSCLSILGGRVQSKEKRRFWHRMEGCQPDGQLRSEEIHEGLPIAVALIPAPSPFLAFKNWF
ncbi:MAG TPA: hypothetical protein VNO32_51780, partial [Candidatus Acidoferrum sp.]|nr:hypothetical protein [Candidatus Acidoferrum sp.]